MNWKCEWCWKNNKNERKKMQLFIENGKKGAKTIYVLIISCNKDEFKNGSVGVWCIIMIERMWKKRVSTILNEWEWSERETEKERERWKNESKKTSERMLYTDRVSWRMIWFFHRPGKRDLLIYFPYLLATITAMDGGSFSLWMWCASFKQILAAYMWECIQIVVLSIVLWWLELNWLDLAWLSDRIETDRIGSWDMKLPLDQGNKWISKRE